MLGTVNCIYETPCGWCSKWDKKCDRKQFKHELKNSLTLKILYMMLRLKNNTDILQELEEFK